MLEQIYALTSCTVTTKKNYVGSAKIFLILKLFIIDLSLLKSLLPFMKRLENETSHKLSKKKIGLH